MNLNPNKYSSANVKTELYIVRHFSDHSENNIVNVSQYYSHCKVSK